MRFPDDAPMDEGWGADRLPGWLPWVQIGLSTMLAVLFLVMLGRTRDQSRTIEALQLKVRGLENSRALDRSTGLEQQMRSMLERLRKVEAQGAMLETLGAERLQLERELQEFRSRSAIQPQGGGSLPAPAVPPVSVPAPPPPVPGAVPRQGTGVLRPPGDGRY